MRSEPNPVQEERMIHKLILGTAGLGGQEYAGRTVTREDAYAIMKRAFDLGIYSFDTAPSYGYAEDLLTSAFFSGCVQIYTKSNGPVPLRKKMLKIKPKPIVLWHNWEMKEETDADLDNNHGVSLYQDSLLDAVSCGWKLIECEWNLLRQCPIPDGITFIARSVFGRGLAKKSLIAQEIANALDLDVHQLFLQAALQHPKIDHVIIGPQTIEELEQCVAWARKPLNFWQVLDVADRKLTDPRLYK
jgi:aryl-alcohol dehydrogenase-like predicted oxidoreductase